VLWPEAPPGLAAKHLPKQQARWRGHVTDGTTLAPEPGLHADEAINQPA
jgi:hypothetical protein